MAQEIYSSHRLDEYTFRHASLGAPQMEHAILAAKPNASIQELQDRLERESTLKATREAAVQAFLVHKGSTIGREALLALDENDGCTAAFDSWLESPQGQSFIPRILAWPAAPIGGKSLRMAAAA